MCFYHKIGYDTTSLSLAYVCYELAQHPDIQRRVQREIDAAIEHGGGRMLTYSQVMGLEYTDQVILETLRYHSIIPYLQRGCTKDYKLPGLDFTIPEDMEVHINIYGLHHDKR